MESSFEISDLIRGLAEQGCQVHSRKAVETVINSYQIMKRDQVEVEDIYKPKGEWDSYIKQREDYYSVFLSDEVNDSEETLLNFWRNGLSAIVKQYASFALLKENDNERKKFLDKMNIDLLVYKMLSNNKNIQSLAVPNVGNVWGLFLEDTLIVPKSLRYKLLSEQIASLISDELLPVVCEIGGGYGGMAYYLSHDSHCVYFDFDLPETLVIAMYYHLCASPSKRIFIYHGMDNIPSWKELIDNYDLIFMPNWCLALLPPQSVTLFVNTFSFSEMTFPVLQHYFSIIEMSCNKYLLHNNMDRPGVFQHGIERVPASKYPINFNVFKMVYKKFDSFQLKKNGRDGDYREYLFMRRGV